MRGERTLQSLLAHYHYYRSARHISAFTNSCCEQYSGIYVHQWAESFSRIRLTESFSRGSVRLSEFGCRLWSKVCNRLLTSCIGFSIRLYPCELQSNHNAQLFSIFFTYSQLSSYHLNFLHIFPNLCFFIFLWIWSQRQIHLQSQCNPIHYITASINFAQIHF